MFGELAPVFITFCVIIFLFLLIAFATGMFNSKFRNGKDSEY